MAGRTLVNIPTELLEQVERGNVLLFIGEHLSHDPAGEAVLDHLTAELAQRAGLTDDSTLTFPEIAQMYEDERGRQALVDFVSRRIQELGDEPQLVHRLIAGLTQCSVLVTTTLSGRMERAFREAGRKLQVVIRNEDIAFEDEQVAQLYKLRGSLDQRDSLILTEDDNEQFFNDQDSISVVLQGYFARKTILFIGYHLEDDNFKRLYSKITASLDPYSRRSYAFGETPPPNVARWCKRKGIDVVRVDTTAFLQALTDQLAARARPTSVAMVSSEPVGASLPEQPYKLLDYYETNDAAIYFGREREIMELSSQIRAHRLTLLYGASGVGKTSLLLAGVVPRLAKQDQSYEAIYARALEDPAQVIRRAVSRRLPDAALPQDGLLVDFLAVATSALGRPMVLMLDQFEEFFIRLSPQFRAAFIAELGATCDARDVPIKVVLSLREDWLASVNELERRIPEVFRNRMRVLPLTREQARQAITAPVERLGVHYEPALVERLLEALAGSSGAEILPPQLQLVCSALYRRLPSGEYTIALASYEQIGGARGVLQQYLDDELARLNRDDRTLARSALAELVTSQGTKAVRTAGDLAVALDAARETLAPVLELLVRARLLRVIEQEDGVLCYELAHEYLIREIELEADAKTRKQAEELIRQEVDNWRRFGTLLAADKLALINDVRAVLRLGPEAQELLLRSALEVGDEIEYWLGRIDDPAQRAGVLADKARTRVPAVRMRTAIVLGTQDVPESVEPLLGMALHDPDLTVRDAAQASLAKLTDQRTAIVERLQTAAQSRDREERAAALRTLARLPVRGLPARVQAQVRMTQARMGAAWLVATPRRRSVTLPLAAVLAAITLVYMFAVNCYYIDSTRPFLTDTVTEADSANEIVVRQGLPWLPLPGLNQPAIYTGVSISRVPKQQRQEIQRKRVWGLWLLHGSRPYEKWGKDLATVLYLEDGVPLLWYMNQDEGLKAILETTHSSDSFSRRWSAYALEEIAAVKPAVAPQAVQQLTRLLDDPDPRTRLTAAAALSAMPQVPEPTMNTAYTALKELIAKRPFTNGDGGVWSDATLVIGRLAATNHAPAAETIALLVPLLQDNSENIRGNAANALGDLANIAPDRIAQAAPMLTALLQDRSDLVRGQAAIALGKLARASPDRLAQTLSLLTPLLADPEFLARIGAESAFVELAQASPQATGQVITALKPLLANTDDNMRANAVSTLGRMAVSNPAMADQLMPLILPLLKDTKSSVANQAVTTLGQIGRATPSTTTKVVSLLILLLDHDELGSNTVRTLQQIGQSRPDAVPQIAAALMRLVEDDHVPNYVRLGAAQALTTMPGTPQEHIAQAIKVLTSRLGDNDSAVRRTVAVVLAEIPEVPLPISTQVVTTLLPLTDDRYGPESYVAMQGLIRAGILHPAATAQSVDAIIPLLDKPGLNIAAAWALAQVAEADPSAVPPRTVSKLYDILNSYGADPQNGPWSGSQFVGNFVQRTLHAEHGDDLLMGSLTHPLNPHERPVAAQALFEIALRDRAHGQAFRARLEPLAAGDQPVARLWANIALHLLDFADLAHEAKDAPAKYDALIADLTRRSAVPIAQWRSHPFFAYDARATQQALDWLAQQVDQPADK